MQWNFMPIFERLQYAFYVLIVVSAIFGLGLSIVQAVGPLDDFSVIGFLTHPLFITSVYAVGFIMAPTLYKRLPFKRDWQ